MGWVKLDDNFAAHDKLSDAGPLGMALHVAGICHAARFLTDGFVKRSAVPKLVSFDEIDDAVGEPGYGRKTAIEKLEESGLWAWDQQKQGWWIHDYLDYNPSAEAVLSKRDADRNRKRNHDDGDMSDSTRIPNGIPTDSRPPVPEPHDLTISRSGSKTERVRANYEPTCEPYLMARRLADRIHASNPRAKPTTEATLQSWADVARLMHERDGQSYSDIGHVIDWAQEDSFWHDKILSMGKVRDKWDQLTAKAFAPPVVLRSNGGSDKPFVRPQYEQPMPEYLRG